MYFISLFKIDVNARGVSFNWKENIIRNSSDWNGDLQKNINDQLNIQTKKTIFISQPWGIPKTLIFLLLNINTYLKGEFWQFEIFKLCSVFEATDQSAYIFFINPNTNI